MAKGDFKVRPALMPSYLGNTLILILQGVAKLLVPFTIAALAQKIFEENDTSFCECHRSQLLNIVAVSPETF
jgi:hypothetical protein